MPWLREILKERQQQKYSEILCKARQNWDYNTEWHPDSKNNLLLIKYQHLGILSHSSGPGWSSHLPKRAKLKAHKHFQSTSDFGFTGNITITKVHSMMFWHTLLEETAMKFINAIKDPLIECRMAYLEWRLELQLKTLVFMQYKIVTF